MAEDEEFAVAVVLAATIFGAESLPEDEVALAVPKAIFLRYGLAVVGAVKILALSLQFSDAGDVGRNAYFIVRDAFGSPNATDFVGAFAEDFHLPHLVFVGNGDALAAVAVTVFFHEFSDELDGVAGVVAAHQCDAFKLLNHKHSFFVDQCVWP